MRKMKKWFVLLYLFLSFNAYEASSNPQPCITNGILHQLADRNTRPDRGQNIENLDDMIRAFSSGLVPDLNNPSQRNAFEIYRKMRFGNPDTNLNANTLDEVAKAIKQHPELEKEVFRDFQLEVQHRSYPVTKELSTFLDSQTKSAGQTRSNLFQLEANSGYWKKVFQYEESLPPSGIAKGEAKEIAKANAKK